jgi:formate-dependent nitrite reductase membrane component NrfD
MHHNDSARSDDGRNIDPSLGTLTGEGAQQRIEQPDPHPDREPEVWTHRPDESLGDEPTYYDRPVLRQPVWIWAVPAYFYVGGVAGAAATLGAVVQALARERMWTLVVRCRWLAALGGMLGTALLIYDLGRPERFLNMLRVFRISSPMSVGSWVLAAAGSFTFGSAILAHTQGPLRKLGDLAGYIAALAGLPLAGYTAVLIAKTAVPVWQAARTHLSFLFIGSAMASAASLLKFMFLSRAEEKSVNAFYIAGLSTELATEFLMERQVSRVEPVGKPLEEGVSGALLKAAKVMSILGLVLALLPGGSRPKRILEGLLGTLGSICLRFGIFYAGNASARDPRATFRQQRAGEEKG